MSRHAYSQLPPVQIAAGSSADLTSDHREDVDILSSDPVEDPYLDMNYLDQLLSELGADNQGSRNAVNVSDENAATWLAGEPFFHDPHFTHDFSTSNVDFASIPSHTPNTLYNPEDYFDFDLSQFQQSSEDTPASVLFAATSPSDNESFLDLLLSQDDQTIMLPLNGSEYIQELPSLAKLPPEAEPVAHHNSGCLPQDSVVVNSSDLPVTSPEDATTIASDESTFEFEQAEQAISGTFPTCDNLVGMTRPKFSSLPLPHVEDENIPPSQPIIGRQHTTLHDVSNMADWQYGLLGEQPTALKPEGFLHEDHSQGQQISGTPYNHSVTSPENTVPAYFQPQCPQGYQICHPSASYSEAPPDQSSTYFGRVSTAENFPSMLPSAYSQGPQAGQFGITGMYGFGAVSVTFPFGFNQFPAATGNSVSHKGSAFMQPDAYAYHTQGSAFPVIPPYAFPPSFKNIFPQAEMTHEQFEHSLMFPPSLGAASSALSPSEPPQPVTVVPLTLDERSMFILSSMTGPKPKFTGVEHIASIFSISIDEADPILIEQTEGFKCLLRPKTGEVCHQILPGRRSVCHDHIVKNHYDKAAGVDVICTWPNCGVRVKWESLTKHVLGHANALPHRCPFCATVLSRKDSALRHLREGNCSVLRQRWHEARAASAAHGDVQDGLHGFAQPTPPQVSDDEDTYDSGSDVEDLDRRIGPNKRSRTR